MRRDRYNSSMSREDLVRFARRDWAAIEASKMRHWIDRKATMTPAELLQLGDDLHRYVRSIRPDWPSAEERRADHENHRRVGEMLRAVARRGLK